MQYVFEIHSNELASGPGLYAWCLRATRHTFTISSMNAAAKMYALAGCFPDLPIGIAKALAEKDVGDPGIASMDGQQHFVEVTLDEALEKITITASPMFPVEVSQ